MNPKVTIYGIKNGSMVEFPDGTLFRWADRHPLEGKKYEIAGYTVEIEKSQLNGITGYYDAAGRVVAVDDGAAPLQTNSKTGYLMCRRCKMEKTIAQWQCDWRCECPGNSDGHENRRPTERQWTAV